MRILLRAIEMISRMKFNAPTLEIKAFHSCYFKGVTREVRNKSVVMVTENSNHNGVTSMSCLKKVIDTVRRNAVSHSPVSFCGVMLWALNFDADLFFNY